MYAGHFAAGLAIKACEPRAPTWALAFGGLFLRSGRPVALAAAFAVFSHFLLDIPMHPPDLALVPHGLAHLGFGLWKRLPLGWWWVELAFIAACSAYYLNRARSSRTFGGRAGWACAVVVALHILNSPLLASAR
jgi:hypothetical protein